MPKDMGYYIGYKICEAYYRNVKDKKQAIKDILEIKDFNQFLKDSGYQGKSPLGFHDPILLPLTLHEEQRAKFFGRDCQHGQDQDSIPHAAIYEVS